MGTRDTYFNGYGLTYNEVKKIEDKCKNAKGRENPLFLPVVAAFPVVPRTRVIPATSAS